MSPVLAVDDAENSTIPAVVDTDESLAEEAEVLTAAPGYAAWLARRTLSDGHQRAALARMRQWTAAPRIDVLILDDDTDPLARAVSIASLGAQLCHAQAIETCAAGDVAAINAYLATSTADWVQIIHAGDRLDTIALYLLADRVMNDAELDVIYSDEDTDGADGFTDPIFRPDVNLDLLRSYPYTGRALAVRRTRVLELGGFDVERGGLFLHDYLFRLIEQVGLPAIGHIDDVVYHATLPFTAWLAQPAVAEYTRATLGAHLDRLQVGHRLHEGPFAASHRIEYLHASKPLVSIVVPIHNQFAHLAALVESLLANTAYPAYEILLVDNASDEPATRSYLDGIDRLQGSPLRVLRHTEPADLAMLCNSAFADARGEYLLFLDVNSATLHSDWLEQMVQHAQRPEVGIVGARLHSPDSNIQHGGVVLGLRGSADHAFLGEPADAPGYMQRLQVDQNYSAVSGACLLVRKSVFMQVDGFSDADFPNTFHAVDFCLKVRQAGFLTVWTPHARLLHGGRSRMLHTRIELANLQETLLSNVEQQALTKRWLPWLAHDPAYNRNLSLMNAGFTLNEQRHVAWQPFATPVLSRALCLPADNTGCGHYRVRQPFKAMQDAGLLDGMVGERYLVPVELARFEADVVVLQRQLSATQRTRMLELKELSRAFRVYELDDYIGNLPLKSVHRADMPADVLKTLRRALNTVDRFVVSTAPLAEQLSGFHGDIRIVHNRLPTTWWADLKNERRVGEKPRVGWGGGASHRGDLELIADVVRDLADEVEWVFFGMCPDKLRPYIHEFHEGVPIEGYAAKLASLNLDLALAPLEDNVFNACKSNLRLLEYGACGFPVICSDNICYRGDLPVTRVKNRYRDWVGAIRMHLADLDAAAKAGDALRDAVMQDWMLTGQHLVEWRDAWLPG